MRGHRKGRVLLAAICAATAVLVTAVAPAQGAAGDPLFVFIPAPPKTPPIIPPPTGYLNGPCGLAVDSTSRIYVADYYHHAIDVFTASPAYETQLGNVDPLDGPCGLALDISGHLYVNNYHRNVVRYGTSPTFGVGAVLPLPTEDTSHHLPTGVAVDPATNNVDVNHRTYISAYDSSGNPVLDGSEPLKIGLGTLEDGYGLAVSGFAGTFGYVYVPDAGTNTVKVYNPASDKVNPVATIKDPSNKPFVSLRDAAIAVDNATGDVYIADNTQPKYTERPQAIIYVYSSIGVYKGHLKYNVVDAMPPGLAVDNAIGHATQGRVYVTSGNTSQAGFYAYAPGSATFNSPLPPTFSLSISTSGNGGGSVASTVAKLDCSAECQENLLSGGDVPLTATPDPGSEFTGWSGGCSGEGECVITMDEATSVAAHFVEIPAGTPADQPGPGQSEPVPSTQAPTNRKHEYHRRGRGRRHRAKHCHRRAHHTRANGRCW